MGKDTLTRSLTRMIRSRRVQDSDLRNAERYVRDWLGSAVAGAATNPGQILQRYAKRRTGLEGRVFLAAALSHITETDDLHRGSVSHPACVVIPVALHLGEELDASGHRILSAVLAGYEAMLRVGEALGPAHYRTFHNTATAGVFGSAAAAASLLHLDEDEWVWALGNAGTQASGLWQFIEDAAMSKHLHAGHAAEAGLKAALLAGEGFTGASAILEGEQGLFKGFCPDADPPAVLRDASGWKLTETSFKPYPSCRHTHAAIDAALDVRSCLQAAGADPCSVSAVRIESYPAGLRLTDNPAPDSSYRAQFSIQFCVARALAHGKPTPASFEGEALWDPQVRAIMGRTEVGAAEDLAAAYPRHWGAVVEAVADGRRERARRADPTGDPEAPLSDADLDDKFRSLCAYGGLDAARTEWLLHGCRALVNDAAVFGMPWIEH